VVQGEESDGINNLIAARIKLSGMLHTLSSAPASSDSAVTAASVVPGSPGASAGISAERGLSSSDRGRFFMASSSVNWNGGDTDFQVPSLDNINADILHQWEQSLAIKPAVLTTDLTLVPIYELVEDEAKRMCLRSALDDLLQGELRVSRDDFVRPSMASLTESLDEIAVRVQSEVLERQARLESVTTRKAAVAMSKPSTKCCIL